MKTPLVVLDSGEILVFHSLRDLEGYVESPDISSYQVFDAEGHLVIFQSEAGQAGHTIDVNPVRAIGLHSSSQEDVLDRAIKSFLRKIDASVSESAQLSDLIQILVDNIGYTNFERPGLK